MDNYNYGGQQYPQNYGYGNNYASYGTHQTPQERLQELEQQYGSRGRARQSQGQQQGGQVIPAIVPINDEQDLLSYKPDLTGKPEIFTNVNTGRNYLRFFNTNNAKMVYFNCLEEDINNIINNAMQSKVTPQTNANADMAIQSLEAKYTDLNDRFTELERSWVNNGKSTGSNKSSNATKPASKGNVKSSATNEPAGE